MNIRKWSFVNNRRVCGWRALDLFEALTQSTPSFLGYKNYKKASQGLESYFSPSGTHLSQPFWWLVFCGCSKSMGRPPTHPPACQPQFTQSAYWRAALCRSETNSFHMQAYLWVTHRVSWPCLFLSLAHILLSAQIKFRTARLIPTCWNQYLSCELRAICTQCGTSHRF